MSGHFFVVCGIGHFGYRLADLLLRLGEAVCVVTLDTRQEWLSALERRGARIVRGDARAPEQLRTAGIDTARALLVATKDGLTAIEIAVQARQLRPDLHLVVRLFDQQLARQLEKALGIRALGMSALAAPAFAAAAIGEHRIASFVFEGRPFAIGRVVVGAGSPLRGLTVEDVETRHRALVLDVAGDGALPGVRLEDGARPTLLAGGDEWPRLLGPLPARPPASRRARLQPRRWLGTVRAAWNNAPPLLRSVFLLFNCLIAASVFVFRFALDLSFVDALYFLVTTVTTVGYGDYNLRDSGPALKIYGSLVMLLGSATIATLYSILTDFVVSARVQQLRGRHPLPEEEPILVVGLGNVGFRLLEELRHAGAPAVAVERDPDCPFTPAAAAHVPVVLGDGRLPEILEKAGAARAHAVVAVTGDDAANLGVALAVRELNPEARTIVRLFDADFAAKVEGSLGLSAALSASLTAAPTFAAAALLPDALTAFSSQGRFFAVAPRKVSLEHAGQRPSQLRIGGDLRVVLRRPAAGGGYELPRDDRPLDLGEEVVVLVTRRLA